jgi:hypothetical protein
VPTRGDCRDPFKDTSTAAATTAISSTRATTANDQILDF